MKKGKIHMRKLIPSFAVAFIVAFTFVSGASAHTIQVSQAHRQIRLSPRHITPNDVHGGGCSSWNTNGTGDISAKACISYAYPYLQPDGYASFHKLSGSNQHGGIQSCRFRLKVYEGTSLLDQIDYDCLDAAKAYQQYVHFGPLSVFATGDGVAYSSAVQVNIGYNDGYGTVLYSYSSPEQFI